MRCVVCKKECVPDKYYSFSGAKDVYCCSEQCFTSFLASRKTQEEKNKFYEMLYRIFGTRNLPTKIYVEVERLRKEGYGYKKLTATAHYLYDIKQIPIYSPTVFYIKEGLFEAQEYYKAQEAKDEKNKKILAKKKEPAPKRQMIPNYQEKKRNGLWVNLEDV